ncbi:hypothetical protein GCM10025868_21560 [Angustibacter aerolatus]|uniref:Uncharacterized protein n=1 Tax=Angustibacter aerolatus TaxID=1162965 RepID=A0ABQ6JFC5_9ACTN|nr:hypothetical protein GCM10025868_21560 [Angustibacter aerolatus]
MVVGLEGRQHHDAGPRAGVRQPPGGLDAAGARHAHVHEHDVGVERLDGRDGLRAVRRLADHDDAPDPVDHQPQPGAHEPLVVDDEHADRRGPGVVRVVGVVLGRAA